MNVSGAIAPDKTRKGRTVRGSVLIDIPSGLHVQSNKPLDKYLIPTKLDIETPQGMKVGPISYPRAVMRNLKFSKGAVAVYEGRAIIRFNLTVPANYSGSSGEIKGKLRFQACNDECMFSARDARREDVARRGVNWSRPTTAINRPPSVHFFSWR